MGRTPLTRSGFDTGEHTYMLCGWRTRSEIAITGVPTLANDFGNRDVVIQIATDDPPVVEDTGRFVFQHTPEYSVIKVKGVANFEIRGGTQIRVWPATEATQKDIEIFLFGQVWATLCYQRGVFPLHASAIATEKGITAFAGHSGAGKSTTAALLNSLGHELIADDILPISFEHNSIPGAWPYIRRLKLRHGPIAQFGFTPTEIVSEDLDNEKFFVRAEHSDSHEWRRLDRVYLLDDDLYSVGPVEEISGAEAVRALVDQTYHFKFILDTRRFADHLEFCTRLASKIRIYRLRPSPLSDAKQMLRSLVCNAA